MKNILFIFTGSRCFNNIFCTRDLLDACQESKVLSPISRNITLVTMSGKFWLRKELRRSLICSQLADRQLCRLAWPTELQQLPRARAIVNINTL